MAERDNSERRTLLTAVTLAVIMIVIAGTMGMYVIADPGLEQAILMAQTARKIQQLHPSQYDPNELIDQARRAMFDRLDRYSSYVDTRDFARMREEEAGSYSGIGVTVTNHQLGLQVVAVRENGPANEAGIVTGDVIAGADSVSFRGLDIGECSSYLRGEEGTAVNVLVVRGLGFDSLRVDVTRGDIPFVHVTFAGVTPDSLAYIRLVDFDYGSSDAVKQALDSLLTQNDTPVQGVILDVRGNPGGLFHEAYRTADLFLKDGTFIVGQDGRSRWDDLEFHATDDDMTGGLPIAVLVDGNSASASEIVAGALKHADRAILVGDTTFGKGLVQGFVHFPDGDGLRLTIARYYFQGGHYLNRFDSTLEETGRGLAPDYYFRNYDDRAFPRALNNSLLLEQFVQANLERLRQVIEQPQLDDRWVDDVADFCRLNGFQYSSNLTERVQDLATVSIFERRTDGRMYDVLDSMLILADSLDRNRFRDHGDYIKMRLKQVVRERLYGFSNAYEHVIIREEPGIRYATELLRGQTL